MVEGREETEPKDGEFHLLVGEARHEGGGLGVHVRGGGGEVVGNKFRGTDGLAEETEAIDFLFGARVGGR